jgi:superfamily II DNA or RNA helicase
MGRTYNDVGLYLPPIIENVLTVQWDSTLWKEYVKMKTTMKIDTNNGYSVEINPSSLLHTLRMFCANPDKVEAVKKLLEDIPGEAPIILFCWYRDCAEMLADEFALVPSSVRIHGGYSQAERLRRASALDSRVKCVTMASASEGVDWSDASTVIFFEEDYVPGKIYQALSRVRRWSEDGEKEGKQPIMVYYVHMARSADVAVHEAVVERNGDVARILRRALK